MTGIVILDYNNAKDTINCIESVVKHTPREAYKLIVVENGSRQETTDVVERYVRETFADECLVISDGDKPGALPFVTLLISKTNDGFAEGNNKALRIVDHDEDIDHIMILNNDILFVEDIVTPLVRYCDVLPSCGIVSATLLKRDGKSIDVNCARLDYKKMQFFWEYLFSFKDLFGVLSRYTKRQRMLISHPELAEKEYFDIEMPSGSCMLLKKSVFRDIGYFDNHTFLYFEENILFRKMQRKGLKNYLVPSVKCIHLGAATTGKQSTTYFTQKCHMESNAYYLKEYCNAPLLAAYVRVMSKLTLLKIRLQNLF